MRGLLQSGPSPSASPAQKSLFAVNYGGSFDIRGTVLYIGLSVGVLIVGLIVTCLVICYWFRPSQRRREAALAAQRQRETALQEVKAETDNFKPQVRPFPVLVVQPGSEEVAFGLSDETPSEAYYDGKMMSTMSSMSSSDYTSTSSQCQGMRPSSSHASISSMGGMTPRESADSEALRGENCPSTASPPLGAVLEHPQTGVGNENLIATASSNGSSGEEFVHYNPLTHFVTDRHPRLFTAEVLYSPSQEQEQLPGLPRNT